MNDKPLFQAWVMNTEFTVLAYDINNHILNMPAENTREAWAELYAKLHPCNQRAIDALHLAWDHYEAGVLSFFGWLRKVSQDNLGGSFGIYTWILSCDDDDAGIANNLDAWLMKLRGDGAEPVILAYVTEVLWPMYEAYVDAAVKEHRLR